MIIGGGLGVRFGEPYVQRIEQAMGQHLFPGHQPPAVHLVGLGDLGGAIGAALLVALDAESPGKLTPDCPIATALLDKIRRICVRNPTASRGAAGKTRRRT